MIILRRFNESTLKCPKLDNLFSAKYWFNLRDRKRRVMAAKMLAVTQQTKSTQKYFCCSCVRLLVHRFTFSMLYENIRVKNKNVVDKNKNVVDKNILPNSVCLARK